MERLPVRGDGYTLDLDSTVFERYGEQEGSLKGHNPRKHGRPSHHPLLAVLSEAHFLLHGWLRMVGCEKLFQGADRKFTEFGGWVDVGLNSDSVLVSPRRIMPSVVCQIHFTLNRTR